MRKTVRSRFGSPWQQALLAGLMMTMLTNTPLLAADGLLILKNGDRITGDIRKLQNGDLSIKPSYGENTFVIDWSDVERIESQENFVFETLRGRRLTGSLSTDPRQPGRLLIGKTTPVEQSELVTMTPVEEGFWRRMNVAVDFGFSFTKAAETRQLSLRAQSDYSTESWLARAEWSTLQSLSRDTISSDRSEIRAAYERFLTDRWFALATADFLESDELQLDLRSTLGGGLGSYLFRSNRWYLSVAGGGAWTSERFLDQAVSRANSGEAYGMLDFNAFDIGNLDLLTRFSVLPSLSQWGRYRLNFSTDVRWELVTDLYFNLGFTDNFDSSPLGDAPRNDYAFTTSIGWEY